MLNKIINFTTLLFIGVCISFGVSTISLLISWCVVFMTTGQVINQVWSLDIVLLIQLISSCTVAPMFVWFNKDFIGD